MSWEYLALGACSTSDDNSEVMPGPHAVLVVDEQNNKPETCPTHFPAYPLNFTAACMQYQFEAPLGTNEHHASHL